MSGAISSNEIAPFVIVLAVVVLIALVKQSSRNRRAAALQRVAPQIGFTYEAEAGSAPSLRIHSPREISNIMRGSAGGFEAVVYYYMYTAGTGRDRRDYAQTVAAFKMPVALPDFEMRPESFLNKIGSAFGRQDIDLS